MATLQSDVDGIHHLNWAFPQVKASQKRATGLFQDEPLFSLQQESFDGFQNADPLGFSRNMTPDGAVAHQPSLSNGASPFSVTAKPVSLTAFKAAKQMAVADNAEENDQDLSYRDRKNAFRDAIQTLNDPRSIALMDRLEYEQDHNQAIPDNGRFGTNGMSLMSNLSLDDPLWNCTGDQAIPREERQKYIDAAKLALDPANEKPFLNDVDGGDGIFEPGDLQRWLDRYIDPEPYDFAEKSTFKDNLQTLNDPRSIALMDRLEYEQDHNQAIPDNGRFGTNGMYLLSNLSLDDPLWSCTGDQAIPREERQKYIDAANYVLHTPSAQPFLNEVHGGDYIFEPGDLQRWIDNYNNPGDTANGNIDPFHQGDIGDCWFLSSINAVSKDPEGKDLLKHSITAYSDGTFSVVFPGDPKQEVYYVTQADLASNENAIFSQHDLDTKILEIAGNQYRLKNMGQNLDGGWADSPEGIALLTGQPTQSLMGSTAAETKQNLIDIANTDQDGLTLTFGISDRIGDTHFEGSGHELAITNIDVANNTISYQNPWHTEITETMNLDQFVQEMTDRGIELTYEEVEAA